MKAVFWISLLTIFYIFAGYPLLLALVARFRSRRNSPPGEAELPFVTFIVPVHDEIRIIEDKLRNTLLLDYPRDRLLILVVSDASQDGTDDVARRFAEDGGIELLRLARRSGKGEALNLGLERARGDVVVFSDASILLERDALRNIVRPMIAPDIGCVSGEDYIPGGGGESAYGRYELLLRNLESKVGSIVGASGCFYAQRLELCRPFIAGMAPDFLAVLQTVEGGYRAVTEPSARGEMRVVRQSSHEYQRKVRTMLRGMTTIIRFRRMLNPLRHGVFAIQLLSHKVMRWSVGLFLITLLAGNVASAGHAGYRWFLLLQILFYGSALVGWLAPGKIANALPFRMPFFFCMVNWAGLVAWFRFLAGVRQEIWEPSRR